MTDHSNESVRWVVSYRGSILTEPFDELDEAEKKRDEIATNNPLVNGYEVDAL